MFMSNVTQFETVTQFRFGILSSQDQGNQFLKFFKCINTVVDVFTKKQNDMRHHMTHHFAKVWLSFQSNQRERNDWAPNKKIGSIHHKSG